MAGGDTCAGARRIGDLPSCYNSGEIKETATQKGRRCHREMVRSITITVRTTTGRAKHNKPRPAPRCRCCHLANSTARSRSHWPYLYSEFFMTSASMATLHVYRNSHECGNKVTQATKNRYLESPPRIIVCCRSPAMSPRPVLRVGRPVRRYLVE